MESCCIPSKSLSRSSRCSFRMKFKLKKIKENKVTFLNAYNENFMKIINTFDQEEFDDCEELIKSCHARQGKIILAGNGGSAAMASHIAVDFSKACGIRAINFNEADLITCYANDYGHDNWMKEALKTYADPNDLVILISSSGNSKNIVNAANFCNKNGIDLMTLSGFSKDNKLNKIGNINIWVNSSYYNFVEMAHHIFLVALVDSISLGRKFVEMR